MRVPVAIAVLALTGGCNALLGVHGFGGSDGGGGDDGGPGGDGSGGDAPGDVPGVAPCNPVKPFDPPQLIKELDDASASVFITDVDTTGTIAYLASDRGGAGLQLWRTTRANPGAPWEPPTLLSPVAPSASVAVTEDGLTAIIDHAADLFIAHRTGTGDQFPTGNALAINVSGAVDETPRLTRDGATLYFTSNRDAGRRDLYTSQRNLDVFGQARSLVGTGMNTTLNESAPALTADELTLYFTRGDQNNNGRAILAVTRPSTGALFNNPLPVVEVNGAGENIVGAVSPDGCTLYITHFDPGSTRAQPYVAVKPPP